MIDQAADIGILAKLKESIGSMSLLGIVAQNNFIDTKVIVTSLTVGVLSAFAASYTIADRTATKLELAQREQAEFRAELHEYMRSRNTEILSLYERMARMETAITSRTYELQRGMDSMTGMSGMQGNRRSRGNNNE